MALSLSGLLTLTSCNEKKFHVEGTITNAADSVLYFENMSLEGPVTVDSVKLSSKGTFSFSGESSANPEFYRLRISGHIINVAVDSTETITVNADYPTMSTGYSIKGNDDCERIRQLSVRQIALQNQAMAIVRNMELSPTEVRDSIMSLILAYKEDISKNYIFKDPKAASSYFALFQTIGSYLIFNPRYDRNDIQAFAAVATSWDTFYPGTVRGENLHNIAITGLQTERIVDAENSKVIDASKVETTGIIDIKLIDNKGQERSLSQLKGKVVLLDFHVFSMADSPKRILSLREIYNKYHAQGLEIYQISLDTDEHFWKQQTAALPWISVRETEGLSSRSLMVYNVQSLPEFFIIDRGNNLVKRSQQVKDIEAEIKSLL